MMQAGQEIKDRIASSIYKQGEQARDAAIWRQRSRTLRDSGRSVPDSDIRATAEYDAAAALINLQAWDRASGVLEKFRCDYPDSEFADDVTQKLAVTYLESGESTRLPPSSSASPRLSREPMMCVAKRCGRRPSCTKRRTLCERATSAERHLARYPNPLSESIEARFRLLEIERQTGNEAERHGASEELVEVDATRGCATIGSNTLPGSDGITGTGRSGTSSV